MAQAELRLDGLGIRKIVEIPPGIKVLSISSNRLRSLGSIVECLTLQEVNLAANKLDEGALAPLAALPALRSLNVSRNNIRDLSPLVLAPPALATQGQPFPALEELNVSSNPLSDVTASMSLRMLRVLTGAGLAVTTLRCIHCSLEVIDLRGCCLQSISGLQALPYLSELILDGNALLSCKDVLVHPALQALRIAHNVISEVSSVQLPSLTELDLASNSLSQVLNLAGAPRLTSLVLRTNQMTSLAQLSALRSLTFLDASHNQIRALEPSLCWSLCPLRVLLLNGNQIYDVEDIAKTMDMAGRLALEHLDLRNNPMSLAFYPLADGVPVWTWEARESFPSFACDRSSDLMEKQDDSAIGGAISRYFSRLTSVCPSLQSLDGFLVRQGSLKQVMQKNLADHQEEGATSSHGSFLPVVDLRAAEKGAAKEGRNVSSNDVGSREGEPQQDGKPNVPLVPAASVEELLYKGEEFEVQQLHIVEKLERAHEELAKQWQELDTERQRAQQQQEQQRERIQHFAREQAELQAGMKVQFESEVQKRYEWETQQQQLLKKRQEELEDQWQKEQQRRKQLWEKEQEEEFLKLQQRFYQLQRQFQEKLDSASHSQQGPSCNDFEAGEAHMQNKGEHRELAHVKDNSPNASHTRGLSRTEVKGSPSRPKASEPQECQETLEPPEPAEAKSLATLSSSLQPGQDLQEPLASGIDDWEVGSRFPMNPEQEGYEMQKTSFAEPRGRPMPPPEHRAKIQIGQASRTLEQQAKSMTAREKPDNISQNGVQHEDRQELPGSDGAFQRALHGRGIWSVDLPEDCKDQPLNVTTSLEAHCRVVSQTHQASRPTFGGRLTRSARFGDLTRLPVALLEASERTQQAQALGAQIDRPTKLVGGWEQKRHGVADVSATNGADAYLKFLHREIAAQRAFVRDIKNAKKNARKESQPTKLQGRKDLQGGGQPHAESAWHCVVSPVNPQVRVALEALISQQAWSLPGQQFAYLYSLGRAIQNRTVPARHHFDALVTRDAAREGGALSPLGFAQRAFFCDKSSKLSEVIASPLGFGAVYQDMALLVALELRHAERLCWPEAATMTGRTIVTEIALGRCHTARSSLQGLAGAVPLARLQAEYQQGADSVYFPHLGIIAILSPSRALPVLLAEYSRKFVGVPTLTATK